MEISDVVTHFIDKGSPSNKEIKTYSELLRLGSARFAKRHLAENLDEAFYKLGLDDRRILHQQTFFIAKKDAQFYTIEDEYIISADPLVKIDFRDVQTAPDNNGPKNRAKFFSFITPDTYCLWQKSTDHYDWQLWDVFNFKYKVSLQPSRIKRIEIQRISRGGARTPLRRIGGQ